MKQISRLVCFTCACISLLYDFSSSAQIPPPGKYPQGYFRNPLDVPINLSGNFGELRPNHFHMGLDLKTLTRENLPVYAAADGYVARIKIEPYGFGRALYINHPNGYTTVYAHLNDFVPAIEEYLKKQQYQQESWSVYLELPPGLLAVKKGDLIASSGNTGGSQAPHLHFEIRRTSDDVNLNPMLFGLPLPDNTVPNILRLAIYDRNRSTYEQSPRLYPLRRTGNAFATVPAAIPVGSDKVSFAITAYDTHTGSTNLNGIYEAWLFDNNELVTGFRMDNISYNDTRYLNAHTDYKTKAAGGSFLQHLSELPGYINSIYTKEKGNGVINTGDGAVHAIRIVVKDANGNTAELKFSVQWNGAQVKTAPAVGKMFFPLMLDVYEDEDCEFYMGEKCLYDSVHVRHTQGPSALPNVLSAVHGVGAAYIPLHDSMLIRIRPTQVIPSDKVGCVVMQRFAGTKKDVKKVEWNKGWATAKFRDLGSFQLVSDEEPPVITPIGIADGADLSKAVRIAFTVRDNMEEINGFRAELDGRWLRFTNDKGRTFIYRFDEKCPPGEHTLVIRVADEAGNWATKTYHFTR